MYIRIPIANILTSPFFSDHNANGNGTKNKPRVPRPFKSGEFSPRFEGWACDARLDVLVNKMAKLACVQRDGYDILTDYNLFLSY
jgi:hypothetical protein